MSATGHSDVSVADTGYLAALASLDRVGPARMRWLAGIGDPADVWQLVCSGHLPRGSTRRAPREAVGPTGQPPPRLEAGLLDSWRRRATQNPDLPSEMERRMAELEVDVLGPADLPSFLQHEPDPPAVLFCSGTLSSDLGHTVGIVGTRRASDYGLRVARQLGRDLSEAGVTVVSGLALGIDGSAHSGALSGPTPAVAVIGAGHDRPCPMRNRHLARSIAQAGLLVSEVPPGISSAPWRFPVRNRLIAAFSEVVIVVESAARGGSMSTVSAALARDRAVMAVPGPLGRTSSEGCHELLRDGAEICTSADDVMSMLRSGASPTTQLAAATQQRSRTETESNQSAGDLARSCDQVDRRSVSKWPGSYRSGNSGSGNSRVEGVDGLAAEILDELAESALTLDTVTLRCAAPMSELTAAITELEAAGAIEIRGGWLERQS